MTPKALIESLKEAPVNIFKWVCTGLREPRDILTLTKRDWTRVEADVAASFLDLLDQKIQTHVLIKKVIVAATTTLLNAYSLQLSAGERRLLIKEPLSSFTGNGYEFSRPLLLRAGMNLIPSLALTSSPLRDDLPIQSLTVKLYGWELAQDHIDYFTTGAAGNVVTVVR